MNRNPLTRIGTAILSLTTKISSFLDEIENKSTDLSDGEVSAMNVIVEGYWNAIMRLEDYIDSQNDGENPKVLLVKKYAMDAQDTYERYGKTVNEWVLEKHPDSKYIPYPEYYD